MCVNAPIRYQSAIFKFSIKALFYLTYYTDKSRGDIKRERQ